jgi:2,3-bisphosphoglycerate-dependent phosphoglycerate mutase
VSGIASDVTSAAATNLPRPEAPPPLHLDRSFLVDSQDARLLTLVRHGQQQRQYGAVLDWAAAMDPPLSELGERQARAVGAAMSTEPVDAVVCSHLRRAHDTAKHIAEAHGLVPSVYPGLREVETFRYLPEGQTPEEALPDVVWRGLQDRFLTERRWDLLPLSERSVEFRERVVSTIEGLRLTHQVKHLVVVCHGGVINAYLASLLGITADMFFMPAHTALSRVRHGEGRHALTSLNETHHLAFGDALITH